MQIQTISTILKATETYVAHDFSSQSHEATTEMNEWHNAVPGYIHRCVMTSNQGSSAMFWITTSQVIPATLKDVLRLMETFALY